MLVYPRNFNRRFIIFNHIKILSLSGCIGTLSTENGLYKCFQELIFADFSSTHITNSGLLAIIEGIKTLKKIVCNNCSHLSTGNLNLSNHRKIDIECSNKVIKFKITPILRSQVPKSQYIIYKVK